MFIRGLSFKTQFKINLMPATFEIFQEVLFRTSYSTTNLSLNANQILAGLHL